MEIMLHPVDWRKSFYGKAGVIEENGNVYLRSYNTIVCGIVDGEFRRFWDEESATTMRHVNAFLAHTGIDGGGIAWWRKQEIDKESLVPILSM